MAQNNVEIKCTTHSSNVSQFLDFTKAFFLEIYHVEYIYTACLQTSNKIVRITNLNRCVYSNKAEILVNINNVSEKKCVKTLQLRVSWLQQDVLQPCMFIFCVQNSVRLE